MENNNIEKEIISLKNASYDFFYFRDIEDQIFKLEGIVWSIGNKKEYALIFKNTGINLFDYNTGKKIEFISINSEKYNLVYLKNRLTKRKPDNFVYLNEIKKFKNLLNTFKKNHNR